MIQMISVCDKEADYMGYLAYKQSHNECFVERDKNIHLFSSPNYNSKTKMYLIINDIVEILNHENDFFMIIYNGKKSIISWIPMESIINGSDLE